MELNPEKNSSNNNGYNESVFVQFCSVYNSFIFYFAYSLTLCSSSHFSRYSGIAYNVNDNGGNFLLDNDHHDDNDHGICGEHNNSVHQ